MGLSFVIIWFRNGPMVQLVAMYYIGICWGLRAGYIEINQSLISKLSYHIFLGIGKFPYGLSWLEKDFLL